MGFFDAILGRTTPPKADLDALFAVSQAAVSLQTQEFAPTGQGAVCYRAGEGAAFAQAEKQAEDLIAIDGSTVEKIDDSYGFRWFSIAEPQQSANAVSSLVTHLHAANSTLRDAGFDQALLCSTIGFASPDGGKFALVYLYKRGTFYPFAPSSESQRDNALELQIRGIIGSDLTIESDLSRWLAIWGAPGL